MSEGESTHIDQVRRLMLAQLHALRAAPAGEALAEELKRSRGVSELSQTIINSARVEVDYLVAIKGAGDVPFLAAADEGLKRLTNGAKPPDKDPLLGGPGEGHKWQTSVVHKLKG